jgi:hypothetical protein
VQLFYRSRNTHNKRVIQHCVLSLAPVCEADDSYATLCSSSYGEWRIPRHILLFDNANVNRGNLDPTSDTAAALP